MALVDVIQFEGDPTTLLWKSPIEDQLLNLEDCG